MPNDRNLLLLAKMAGWSQPDVLARCHLEKFEIQFDNDEIAIFEPQE